MHHLVDKTRVVCKDMFFKPQKTVANQQRTGQTCERRETKPRDLETLIIRGILGTRKTTVAHVRVRAS